MLHEQIIFCFIDQMPPSMRESLYFKDDDARLSFLRGNYITLTNLGKRTYKDHRDAHKSDKHIDTHNGQVAGNDAP